MRITQAIGDLLILNQRIPAVENDGATGTSHTFFEQLLGEHFALRRANGMFVGRDLFLDALESGGDRVGTPPTIHLLGTERALVTCFVSTSQQTRWFENARLFARDQDSQWRLVGWANEPFENLGASVENSGS